MEEVRLIDEVRKKDKKKEKRKERKKERSASQAFTQVIQYSGNYQPNTKRVASFIWKA